MSGRIIHGDATPEAFGIKDSGSRKEFDGGMVRDTEDGKIDYTSCLYGPMFTRWNAHLTKGRAKYPDREDGTPNWTLGQKDPEVLARAKRSAFRHFIGETDEDHAAGVFFNVNVVEFCKDAQTAATDADIDQFLKSRGNADPYVFGDHVREQLKSELTLRNQEYADRRAREAKITV
jgi:hypothetical protein